jgi:sister chromatid cohesion protein PDS5
MDSDEAEIKARLTKLIDALAKMLPDPPKASSDLWMFAKKHDRRSYQLIRFCMAADSDYQTIYKAIKELTKRVQSSSSPGLLDTLTPLLYRSSLLVYNKSHIPAIMRLSKDDNNEIASTAHELLTEISSRTPEVLKAHVNAICRDLETEAPTLKKEDGPGVEDTLKACSGFAKKFPAEIPKDRKFLAAMNNFALYSNSPRAAKHAVSILMSVADKKEAYAKDLIQKCTKDWKYGTPHFLARLSTLAQLNLLAPDQAEEESDAIVHIAIYEILLKSRTPSPDDGYEWSETVDEETTAKELALKMLVNRIRSMESDDGIKEQLDAVVRILTRLITGEGELLKSKDSPAAQKSRLRLLAANLTLKICSMRRSVDELWTPQNFNSIAFVAQDSLIEVRTGFITKLKKYLGQSKLGNRWYTIPFLLAYEPFANLKDTTLTWLRARALFFSRPARGQHSTVMESVFARLLSVLAHHPDYSHDTPSDLVDFTRYILFYLSAVANERNLSLIFHVAQRVKQCQDAVSHDAESKEEVNENLYHLSDLAQATIRIFEGYHDNWTPMQTWPGKVKLPNALFAPLPSHDIAQEIAEKNYLPDEADEMIEKIVKSTMRKTSTHTVARKRKIEGGGDATPAKKTKKAKTEKVEKEKALPIRKVGKNKTPKPKAKKGEGDQDNVPSSERRKSGRATGGKSYKEEDSDEDDAEMEEWNEEDEAEDEEDAEAEEESEDAQAGKEDSPDIDVDVDVDDAEGEAEEEVPVQTNGKKTPNRAGKGKGKTSASSPAAIKENRKPPTPAPKGRRTRAAAAAGLDEMED